MINLFYANIVQINKLEKQFKNLWLKYRKIFDTSDLSNVEMKKSEIRWK